MKAQMDTTLNLALALEGSAAPASDEIRRLAGVADMLETLPDPEIDPRFVARLEAVLMAEFDAATPETTEARPALRIVTDEPTPVEKPAAAPAVAPNVIALPRRRFVVRKAVASAIAAAMLSALPVVASASSLPGSPFFGIEQWRQNHAISAAEGSDKAFAMERTARKWIGYGAEMVALDYEASKIDGVLRYAGSLQTRAARIVSTVGTPAEIERLSRMLADDAIELDRLRRMAPAAAKPALHRAIAVTETLSASLTGRVEIPTAAALDRLASVEGAEAPAQPDSAPKTTESAKAPEAPKDGAPATDPKGDETVRKNVDTEIDHQCDTLFSEQAGDWLQGPSSWICKGRDIAEDK